MYRKAIETKSTATRLEALKSRHGMGAVRLNPQVISTTTPNTTSISTGIANARGRRDMTAIRKAALDTGITEKQAARQVQKLDRASTAVKANTSGTGTLKRSTPGVTTLASSSGISKLISTQKKFVGTKDTSIEKRIKLKNDDYQKSYVPSAISRREAEPYRLEDDSDEEEKKEPECTMINTCDNTEDVDMDFDMPSPKDKKRKRISLNKNKKDDEKDSTDESDDEDEKSEESDPEPEWLEKVLNKKDEIDVEKEESIQQMIRKNAIDLAKFKISITKKGLKIEEVSGDGNCLFRSVGDQIFGEESKHEFLREQVCDHLEVNKEEYKWFIEEDKNIDDYISTMRTAGEWGGQLEMSILAKLHMFNVIIYQIEQEDMVQEFHSWDTPDLKTIHLTYHRGRHYNSVRRDSEDDGPAVDQRIRHPLMQLTEA